MIRILMTGASGFVGQNVLKYLQQNKNYIISTPTRSELDLKNEKKVVDYLIEGKFDVILHFANPTPAKNSLDSFDTITDDSLRIFLNFYNHSDLFGKMIYTGSGAEYDKTQNIDVISEDECFRTIPSDSYGLLKMVMNQLAEKSDNVFNFRIFACYGPNDAESKFITHCIRSVILGKQITIRKDCKFDYIHVSDFARYIEWGISADLKSHNYNVTSGQQYWLSDIAEIVRDKMDSKLKIHILSDEMANNYTADNSRIINESGIIPLLKIESGIELQIKWEIDNWSSDTKFDGE